VKRSRTGCEKGDEENHIRRTGINKTAVFTSAP
jgi:hypothetical protein